MTGQRWRRAAGVALAGVLVLAGLVMVRPAAAAPDQYATSIGFAAGRPLSGSTATAPLLVTSGLCPTGTTAINAFVDSATAGLAGAVAISSNTTDIANIATSGISFSFNLLDVAASQGKTLVNGRYEVSVVCLPDLFGSPGTGQFDAVFTVSGGATATSAGTTYTFDPGGNVVGTTTTLTAAPPGQGRLNPPTDDVTLTATVTPVAAGAVQFSEQGAGGALTPLGAPVTVDANGRATLSLGSLTTPPGAGAHTFVAAFTPDDATAFAGSTSAALAYQIIGAGQAETTTTLTADPPVAVTKGDLVTLTAKVDTVPAGGTPPEGSVAFFDGQAPLGQAAATAGTASITLRPSIAGTLALRATFTPTDAVAFAGSTSTPDLTYLVSEPISEGVFLGLLQVTSPNGAGKEDQGKATDLIQLKSAKACKAGSSVVTMRISGPDSWEPGFAIASTGFFAEANDTVATSQSVADVATQNGLTIVPGLYFITATCRASAIDAGIGFFVGQLWFYDAENWLNEDPDKVGIPTVTGVTATPAGRADKGAEVTVTATVTPVAATGKIVFKGASDAGDVELGTVDLKDGTASVSTKTLGLALYYLTAEYQPDTTKYNASTSAEVVYVVAPIVPPLPPKGGAAVTGTVRVGQKATCTAAYTNATAVTYEWFVAGVPVSGATRATYTPVALDAGRFLSCRATAVNAGGFVYRDSPAVRVGR